MGKNWFSAVKKVLTPSSKEKKLEQKLNKSKKKWLGKEEKSEQVSSSDENITVLDVPTPAPHPPLPDDVKSAKEAENENTKHAYTMAFASAVAAAAAAQAAAEVVRLSVAARFPGKSKEEISAIKIQTAFRGYLGRKKLRALRGLMRMKSLIQGQFVKRQATSTLKCMQTLGRVQSQVRARRIRMSEENQALQRQLQQKQEKENEKLNALQLGDDWVHGSQSKEQIEAKLQSRQEAAMRREKALAYAHARQQAWRNSSNPKSADSTFLDPNNPHWGWSWLERWMAARPWESRMSMEEIGRAYLRRDVNNDKKPSPPPRKPSRPPNRQPLPGSPSRTLSMPPSVSRKVKTPGPKSSSLGGDEASRRNKLSSQSERYRRHSIAVSSAETLTNSPSVKSSIQPTPKSSVKAKSSRVPTGSEKNGTTSEKGSTGSAKRRLSLSLSPTSPTGSRRLSLGPSKVNH